MIIVNLLIAIFGSFILVGVIILILLFIGKIQRRYPLKIEITRKLWCMSFAFTAVSPFIMPIKVISHEQFRVLSFGLPFTFIEQYTNQMQEIVSYPFYTTFINPWGHSIAGNLNIRLDIYIFSVICIYLILYTITYKAKTRKTIYK